MMKSKKRVIGIGALFGRQGRILLLDNVFDLGQYKIDQKQHILVIDSTFRLTSDEITYLIAFWTNLRSITCHFGGDEAYRNEDHALKLLGLSKIEKKHLKDSVLTTSSPTIANAIWRAFFLGYACESEDDSPEVDILYFGGDVRLGALRATIQRIRGGWIPSRFDFTCDPRFLDVDSLISLCPNDLDVTTRIAKLAMSDPVNSCKLVLSLARANEVSTAASKILQDLSLQSEGNLAICSHFVLLCHLRTRKRFKANELDKLLSTFQEPNIEVRKTSLWLIGELGSKARCATGALQEHLKHANDLDERVLTAWTLGKVGGGGKNALPVLIGLYEEVLARKAQRYLGSHSALIVYKVIQMLGGSDSLPSENEGDA